MPPRIAEVLERFVDGFNTNDLDDVMTFFSDDAVYRPGDGNEFRGRAAIRAAFLPQFSQAFGTMQFLVDDRVVDEGARKAAIRWVCKHDFETTRSPFMRWMLKARYGKRAGWYGTDIFHFDQEGKIVGKFSYANFGPRPQLRRDLG
jgi:uncharacterized protein (TIGR02246 family)